MRSKELRRSHSGYSMVELLVVVAIIGIISLFAAPAFYTMYQSSKMKTSIRELTAEVRGVRQQATTKNERWKLSFTTGAQGTNSYSTFREVVNPTTGARTWVQQRTRLMNDVVYFAATNMPSELATTTADDDGNFDVIFLPDGTIGNWPIVGGNLAPTATITVRTDMNIPRKQVVLGFSLTGNLKAE
jgi:prepilin-type N-terminal cleavage/methylation domain-containing protein